MVKTSKFRVIVSGMTIVGVILYGVFMSVRLGRENKKLQQQNHQLAEQVIAEQRMAKAREDALSQEILRLGGTVPVIQVIRPPATTVGTEAPAPTRRSEPTRTTGSQTSTTQPPSSRTTTSTTSVPPKPPSSPPEKPCLVTLPIRDGCLVP